VTSGLGGAPRSVAAFVSDRVDEWRQGTRQGQWFAWSVLAACSLVIFGISFLTPITLPVATFAIPLIVGGATLRFRPLGLLVVTVGSLAALSLLLTSHQTSWAGQQAVNVAVVAVTAAILLYIASQDRSGLPGRLGQDMLMELNERLKVQGVVPTLPEGWRAESLLQSAGGAKFAGDFFIAHLHESGDILELVLVDVSGKGVGAGTKSLQFAGALGGLIGTMPPLDLFEAANDFLLRQGWDFSFATAVNVRVDLMSGEFIVTNAGHPPVLHWNRIWSTWDLDSARGMALGIVKKPSFRQSKGMIEAGEALMLYTDGVVETRDSDVDVGIESLRESATKAVRAGFDDAARRVLAEVSGDDDDRAVLILHRERA
jgi:hypothetical protein